MKIAFDIGGVLSKHPHIFFQLIRVLTRTTDTRIDVYIITDMHDRRETLQMLETNGFGFLAESRVLNADYDTYGEACKAVLCKEHGIDILIDDHAGYLAIPGAPPVRLQIVADPYQPYYHEDWKTSGSEGSFGRRAAPPPSLWGCPICSVKYGEACNAEVHKALFDKRITAGFCRAAQDGACIWEHCPQRRDKEPEASGRHCPLDIHDRDGTVIETRPDRLAAYKAERRRIEGSQVPDLSQGQDITTEDRLEAIREQLREVVRERDDRRTECDALREGWKIDREALMRGASSLREALRGLLENASMGDSPWGDRARVALAESEAACDEVGEPMQAYVEGWALHFLSGWADDNPEHAQVAADIADAIDAIALDRRKNNE